MKRRLLIQGAASALAWQLGVKNARGAGGASCRRAALGDFWAAAPGSRRGGRRGGRGIAVCAASPLLAAAIRARTQSQGIKGSKPHVMHQRS